jgi:phage tail protein X
MKKHVTMEGETMEYIAYQVYGFEQQGFDLYEHPSNYGLALNDAHMPGSLTVTLPDFPKPSRYEPYTKLWD